MRRNKGIHWFKKMHLIKGHMRQHLCCLLYPSFLLKFYSRIKSMPAVKRSLTDVPREPKHHQTWCFLCEKHQKNGISYDGTDKNIDVFWFHQWKGNISSISLHDFDFLLNSWMILMKFSLFIDEIKIHQCFCPFHHLNFIFFMFRLPGWEKANSKSVDVQPQNRNK